MILVNMILLILLNLISQAIIHTALTIKAHLTQRATNQQQPIATTQMQHKVINWMTK